MNDIWGIFLLKFNKRDLGRIVQRPISMSKCNFIASCALIGTFLPQKGTVVNSSEVFTEKWEM